jgi:cystathionine beta-lyase
MSIDFDALIERRGTHSNKWDGMKARTGVDPADGIPMWVADMDFAAPEPVRRRLAAQVEHGVFGYYGPDASWRAAASGWSARRHAWEVDPDWITPSAGVCAALGLCCQAFSEPRDGVVVFAPVYHMFGAMIRANGREMIEAPLRVEQGRHRMDLDALGETLPPHARLVFLCSPHNPGGRVWSVEELRALAAFCAERDLILISDEIWRDLVLSEARHIPTALAAPEIADRLVTCVAPSKTFNLAGGALAEVVIADPELRRRYRAAANGSHAMSCNLFGALAAEAAYDEGAPWLDALLPYLAENQRVFAAGLAMAIPGARPMAPEATYLSWVDFSGVNLPDDEVARRIRDVARIGVNAGASFGLGGAGHARFNVACPRATVETALARLSDAFADLR